MSVRPDWMPSEEEIDKAWQLDFIVPVRLGKPSTEALIRHSCLRAQIAVLEELLPCAMRVYGDCEELPLEMVSVDIIEEKIDELRKELGE